MALNLTQKLVQSHLVQGDLTPGSEIALRIDQTLLQDVFGGHAIVGGLNYGQGSSRENAALAPRYLGLEVVLAKSFARIPWQNLVNFGVLPLTFEDPSDYDRLELGDTIEITGVADALAAGKAITARVRGWKEAILMRHDLSPRQIEVLLAGGAINWLRARIQAEPARTVA